MLQNFANQRDSWAQVVVSLHGTTLSQPLGDHQRKSMNSNNNKNKQEQEKKGKKKRNQSPTLGSWDKRETKAENFFTDIFQRPLFLHWTVEATRCGGNSSDWANNTLIGPPLQLFGQTLTASLIISLPTISQTRFQLRN